MPSFTFVSTVNAFVLRGATPVFVDVRPDTLNLDERQLERADHADARGRSCRCTTPASAARWTRSMRSQRRHGVAVVEDNAHGLFGRYRGRPLGTFGALATQSFHETKNFTCGEGGALLINDAAARRARRDPAREGHEPQPVLPRPGRQVHLGRRRLELPAVRRAGGVPARRSSRRASRSRRARRQIWERYARHLRRLGARRTACALPVVPDALRAGVSHVLPAAAVAGGAAGAHRST